MWRPCSPLVRGSWSRNGAFQKELNCLAAFRRRARFYRSFVVSLDQTLDGVIEERPCDMDEAGFGLDVSRQLYNRSRCAALGITSRCVADQRPLQSSSQPRPAVYGSTSRGPIWLYCCIHLLISHLSIDRCSPGSRPGPRFRRFR